MKKFRKLISLMLIIAMTITCLPVVSIAAEESSVEHLTEVPEGYIGIYTKDDLDNIKLDMAGSYILMNDIIFEDSDYEKGGSFYNSGKGFDPIGTTTSNFKGVLDGNNYSIENLYINDTDKDYVGLFGYATNATIKNLNLVNADITGQNYVGGIAGCLFEACTVSDCIVDGSISGENFIGGFCGHQNADTDNGVSLANIIEKSINLSTVTGTEYVGGFSGLMESSHRTYDGGKRANGKLSKIEYCVNNGNITSTSTRCGGISGSAVGTYFSYRGTTYKSCVKYCYNTGDIMGNRLYAGILGMQSYGYAEHCYSIGNIQDSDVRTYSGICTNSSGFFDGCYYLDTSVGENNIEVGISKSEDQLKKQTTFEGWDFDTVWTMEGREDYPYPELRDVPLVLPEDLTHKHEYTSEVTKEATHLEEGKTTYTCECGDTYTEEIAKLTAHTYEKVVTEPTCTTQGYTTYTCECGDSYVDNYVGMLDHEYISEITTPATHLTEGIETFTCDCGDSYTEAIAKLEGHSYTSEVTKEATHLEEGETTYTCECGDSYTEAIAKLEGHTYKSVVTAPTCTSKGYTTYTCECGDTYIADYVDEAEHSFTNYISNNDATCTADGTKTAKCNNCDAKETVVDKGSAKGHSYNLTLTPATCDKEGSKVYTCECGNRYSEVIPALGHKDDNRDGYCDDCREDIDGFVDENECLCICHEEGAGSILYKILLFIQRYFKIDLLKKVMKMNRVCECGVYHY